MAKVKQQLLRALPTADATGLSDTPGRWQQITSSSIPCGEKPDHLMTYLLGSLRPNLFISLGMLESAGKTAVI